MLYTHQPSPAPRCLFVSPIADRRAWFMRAHSGLPGQLHVMGSPGAACLMLACAPVDLLVVDLAQCDPALELANYGALVAQQGASKVLVLCPGRPARLLPALMAYGVIEYAVAPLQESELRALLSSQLDGIASAHPAPADGAQWPALLSMYSRAQGALMQAADSERFGSAICAALLEHPSVCHAGLFLHCAGGMRLLAEQGAPALQLGGLPEGCPDLLPRSAGQSILLEIPAPLPEFDWTGRFAGSGVKLLMALALPSEGVSRGCLCLLFDQPQPLPPALWRALEDMAQLAALGLRIAHTNQENEALMARMTQLATIDAVTRGVNSRHGAHLLEQEMRRASRYRYDLSLVVFGVDRFEGMGNTLSQPVADLVLRRVATTVHAQLRSSDTLVRTNDHQFQVIAPHTNAREAMALAEKLRLAVAQAEIPGYGAVTISIGLAQMAPRESQDALLQRAHGALACTAQPGCQAIHLATH